MIESITYTNLNETSNDYAPEVKMLKRKLNKSIKFTDGINILFAPNGTGKSTILSDLARYHFCYQVGITKITRSSIHKISHWNPFANENNGEKRCIFKNGVQIISDGQVNYISNATCNGTFSLDNDFMSTSDFANAYFERNSSSGEGNIRSFVYGYRKFKNIHYDKLIEIEIGNIKDDEEYYNEIKECLKYVENPVLKPGKPTILIDELDSNTDILNTVYLFKYIKKLSDRYQVIMASHSPLIFELKDVNIIELLYRYKSKCKKAIANINDPNI